MTTTAVVAVPVWEASIVLGADQVLTENDHKHWRYRHPRAKSVRSVSEQTARFTRAPRLERARIVIEILFPDRRRRDTHNLMATAKPIVDGLVDAGLLPDDDARHLAGPHLEASTELSPKRWGQRTFTFNIAVFDLGEEPTP
ncbi:hypothetical protein CWT12_06560 [Actinomyces sp. 432]|uniref:hypothetical protein n=1 Tax=Actinomyces sp. 432 TaxID=2057798 RepID=UPI001373E558|nr:hypothetical protein [Actinomyces sp. 432]QHO91050.1 hypothetical protein CWT12_06560 [Actinomyces sp. 432]